ncbi:MAG: TerC family protein [Haliscomenobacter sp.]|nr:TerC family protein [Haliscomenobacter sp.]MBK7475367.1 TerC family protein [Haliscomenobacter sp.]MBK8877952.1 TerC family protein [Haliscomenobacter sp.]
MALLWIGFIALIILLLALDLGVFNRKAHAISAREALRWTSVWVTVSLLFSIFIFFAYENNWLHYAASSGYSGQKAVLTYLTGYLVEQSLSIDNIFVIAVIFAYFRIPAANQHRVLFWGILGAVVFRGIMIGIGVILIQNFGWVMYLFGAILLYAAYQMYVSGDHEAVEIERNATLRLIKRFLPITKSFHGNRFFVRRMGVTAATPLFVALMVVETTDIMFAFDSIPAIFAITTDPFLVFTSNIFAILGLRSLYFVLASFLDKFTYLRYSLVFILGFVGIKMITANWIHLPEWLSLVVILCALAAGILPSLLLKKSPDEGK